MTGRALGLGSLALAVAALAGCEATTRWPAVAAPEDLLPPVVPASAILRPGAELRMEAPGAGAPRWSSTAPAVATVDSLTGLVRAVAPGRTEIRVRTDTVTRYAPMLVAAGPPPAGPLRTDPATPRYLVDRRGTPVYLSGSHTWPVFQDGGEQDPPSAFQFDAFLDLLEAHNHNFTRLWTWEQAWGATEVPGDYYVSPVPWERTGPGPALDGKPRFDLSRFDEAYFDRLRARVTAAGQRGIFVAVVLFNGWSVSRGDRPGDPWRGHPFHRANNVNGVDGDPDGDGRGLEVHTLVSPALTAIQEAYVRRVVDAVAGLPNVLFEISNESAPASLPWQVHIMEVIRAHEATRDDRHPVGLSVTWPGGGNAELFAGPADWVAPRRFGDDPLEPFPGLLPKVVLNDTDHLCGICGSVAWVWKSLTRGLNPVLMDGYDGGVTGIGDAAYDAADPLWARVRMNLGYARVLAEELDLATARPRPDLASSGYCLAALAPPAHRYLVYTAGAPSVTVDLTATPALLAVEWFEPATGRTLPAAAARAGALTTFTAPLPGDLVLLLTGADIPPRR